MSLPSHAGDGAIVSTLVRECCRVMMRWCCCVDIGWGVLLSDASDGATESC
jgi:hypothetical protein